MLLVNKHYTMVIGVDMHFTTMPPFNPVHPFIGMVFDVGDCIPFIGCNTRVNSIRKGGSDTAGKLGTMKHIPIASGAFAMMPMIGNECMNFYGGQNTYSEERRLSPTGYMLMTCNDAGVPLSLTPGKKYKPKPTLFAPTSMSIPIPSGPPVIVGGPYVPDLGPLLKNMAMGFGMGCLMKKLGKIAKKGGEAIKKALTDFNHNVLKKSNSKWAKNLSEWFCKHGFEPVNLVTGAVEYGGVDFELPGPIPFVWSRKWSSDSRWEGVLGHGCHWEYDMRVEIFPKHEAIAVTLADGRPAAFPTLLPGEHYYNRTEKLTLFHKKDHYELFDYNTRKSFLFPIIKGKREFLLTQVRNEAGHSIRFHYTGERLEKVIDSAGRTLLVETDRENRITKVDFVTARGETETLVRHTYNEQGDMVEITDALGQTTRVVYQNHLMVKKTDRNGQTFYWEYDGTKPKSRCVHTWGDGGILEGWIEYRKGYNLVTDSLGNTTKYEFTPEGYVTAVTNPLGATELSDYTAEGDLLREIDAEGNMTGYSYNEAGQLTGVHYPNGGEQRFQYDDQGRMISETTPEDATMIYDYNGQGLLEYVISPDNQVTRYRYNERHLIEKIESESGDINLEYDDRFNLIKAVFPEGAVAEWQYDEKGNVIGSKSPVGGNNHYSYDLLGRVTRTKTADGNEIKLKYNAYEEVVLAEDRERRVEFEYTPLGSLKKRTENGKALRFSYDTEEQLRALKNENNELYSFHRDQAGQIITETGFDGVRRKYERSLSGSVLRVDRPGGRSTRYRYNAMGQVSGVDYHDGSYERYVYDKAGQLLEARNKNSHLKITRDKLGRIVEEWQDGHIVSSSYNVQGQRDKVTSSLGADLSIGYGETGLLQTMRAGAWDMRLKHDERGFEIERVLSGGVVSRNEYDAIGRIKKSSVTSGKRATRQLRYQWGINDRLISITNELTGKDTQFDYDTMNNLVGATYHRIEKLFRIPDAVGNLYRTQEKKDQKYGAGGRLLESEDTRYHYDEEGNLTEKVKGDGTCWSYRWSANGALQSVLRPDGKEVSFEYDALGRRTAKIFNGNITRWVWDGNTPLHEWKYAVENRPQAIYDEFGFERRDREESVENLITWIFDEGTFKPTAKLTKAGNYSIITDYLGTPAQMYDDAGIKIWEAELDIYGKVRTFEGRSLNDCPFRYQGQYEDEETGLYYNRFRYYDPSIGAYLSQDPIGLDGNNPTIYGYVKDVNSWIDTLGLDSTFFTSSDGLTLEVKNVQDLSHLSDKEISDIYHANNNPKGRGKAPKHPNGDVIVLHHQKQNHLGPVVEMPNSGHVRGLGNKKMHPYFPNPHPKNPVDRDVFNNWKKEYWKNRAETEMKKRGLSCH